MKRKSVSFALLGLSVLALGACGSSGKKESVKVEDPAQKTTASDEISQLLNKVLNVPRGTKKFTKWHETVKENMTTELYTELGVEYFYGRQLPFQENYDKDPKFYNTNFDNNPMGFKTELLDVEKEDEGYKVNALVEVQMGDVSQVGSTQIVYEFLVLFENGKISKMDGSFFDEFKKLIPISIEEYEAQNDVHVSQYAEEGTDPVHKASLKSHLEKVVAALDEEKYYKGFVTKEYLSQFFQSQERGVQAFASALKNHNGEIDYSTLKLEPMPSRSSVVNFAFYILDKDTNGVVALVIGAYGSADGIPRIELKQVDLIRK